MTQKYPIGSILEGKTISYRVIYYEKSLSADKDDHYEVCFDEERKKTCYTKQSILDKLILKK